MLRHFLVLRGASTLLLHNAVQNYRRLPFSNILAYSRPRALYDKHYSLLRSPHANKNAQEHISRTFYQVQLVLHSSASSGSARSDYNIFVQTGQKQNPFISYRYSVTASVTYISAF